MPNFDLTGKAAVVTGGDSGIGRAIAEAFAKHGADVLVTYLNDRAGAEGTVRLIEQAGRRGVASRTDQRTRRRSPSCSRKSRPGSARPSYS
jgi:NAD(P)-dependent dehydrogenase (short-subunit alcohol dehydrogenase family)